MGRTKKSKRATAAEKLQAIQMALEKRFEDGKIAGFKVGCEAERALLRNKAEALKAEERQQQFKALAALGRVADQMATVAEGIAKMVLSLNGHL